MGLSEPDLSFTIPSIHDDLTLDCRIYLPRDLTSGSLSAASAWQRKGAVLAHPYAPLGGCYDDPIIGIVGADLCKAGFVVGYFNFRYA
jgi:alpha/beta superfamily hydrolase